jgi:Ca2+-binding RTX toxin-like protein
MYDVTEMRLEVGLIGGAVDDLLQGDGDDILLAGPCGNLLLRGAGRNSIRGGASVDLIDAGTDADLVEDNQGSDTLGFASASFEPSLAITVTLGESEQVTRGANLTQAPSASLGLGTVFKLYESYGSPSLPAGSQAQGATLYGGSGDDVIYGGQGNDRLFGEDDNDLLVGNEGDDALDGGAGNDELSGGAGRDGLEGGTGDDVLVGGTGADVLSGGAGNDRLIGDAPFLIGVNDYPTGFDRRLTGGDTISFLGDAIGGAANDRDARCAA